MKNILLILSLQLFFASNVYAIKMFENCGPYFQSSVISDESFFNIKSDGEIEIIIPDHKLEKFANKSVLSFTNNKSKYVFEFNNHSSDSEFVSHIVRKKIDENGDETKTNLWFSRMLSSECNAEYSEYTLNLNDSPTELMAKLKNNKSKVEKVILKDINNEQIKFDENGKLSLKLTFTINQERCEELNKYPIDIFELSKESFRKAIDLKNFLMGSLGDEISNNKLLESFNSNSDVVENLSKELSNYISKCNELKEPSIIEADSSSKSITK